MLDKIGLRGSHFTLGQNTGPYASVSQTSYNNKPTQKQMPNVYQNQDVASAVAHDKANLRASHFQLGNSDPKAYFNTMNQVNLKHHENFDRAVLSEAQKKDLRTHHFNLGAYGPYNKTMYTLQYDKKPLSTQNDQEKLKQFMISHHHNFREMGNTMMTSKYNDDYNKEIKPQDLKIGGISQEEMRKKELALRSSHIVLGKENPQFQTVQQKDFTRKANIYEPKTKDLQSSHFSLGNQNDPMCSTNDIFHTQQPIIPNPLAKETMDDLRSSHFKMGQEPINYQSEFSGNFKKNNDNRQQGTVSTAQLQQNHFALGDPQAKNTYQTVYSKTMQKPDASQNLGQARDQKQDRGSNFVIGNQGNFYTSEFNDNFKPHVDSKPSALVEGKKADLRRSHFQFNDIARDTYQTNYKQSFQNRDIGDGRGQLEDALKKDLRKEHFQYGGQQNEYNTTYKTFHHNLGKPQPSVLNETQRLNLRSHHFKFGHLKLQFFKGGETIFHKGENGNLFYIILNGQISITQKEWVLDQESGEKVPNIKELVRLNSGNCFGELGLQNDARRVASAGAVIDSYLAVLEKQDFKDAISELNQDAAYIQYFGKMGFFKEWDYNKIKVIYDVSEEVQFSKDNFVFREGDNFNGVYFVKQGEFRVEKTVDVCQFQENFENKKQKLSHYSSDLKSFLTMIKNQDYEKNLYKKKNRQYKTFILEKCNNGCVLGIEDLFSVKRSFSLVSSSEQSSLYFVPDKMIYTKIFSYYLKNQIKNSVEIKMNYLMSNLKKLIEQHYLNMELLCDLKTNQNPEYIIDSKNKELFEREQVKVMNKQKVQQEKFLQYKSQFEKKSKMKSEQVEQECLQNFANKYKLNQIFEKSSQKHQFYSAQKVLSSHKNDSAQNIQSEKDIVQSKNLSCNNIDDFEKKQGRIKLK
ncbi:Cyclic nucleotide-binding protein [Pseudocohnilembus persalinus]|uniref:Cyclic nucleotide-binding protein n=1 Tax=Pseudocohnilembus persalinus TaxID=266149 RepID=A0A0V0QNU5_PSEPJ|nr:Cyclic nucleotide-binding protein [Pseudocohnilembus persalinus]|eukprot:KRX03844.1 Cyclic nucleotide-binding protein [Pseudocohnilembus persalinus]